MKKLPSVLALITPELIAAAAKPEPEDKAAFKRVARIAPYEYEDRSPDITALLAYLHRPHTEIERRIDAISARLSAECDAVDAAEKAPARAARAVESAAMKPERDRVNRIKQKERADEFYQRNVVGPREAARAEKLASEQAAAPSWEEVEF